MVLPRNMIQFGCQYDIFWLSIAKVYHLECLLMTKLYHISRQNHISYLEMKDADVVTELPTIVFFDSYFVTKTDSYSVQFFFVKESREKGKYRKSRFHKSRYLPFSRDFSKKKNLSKKKSFGYDW
jgi:hypothetical protein